MRPLNFAEQFALPILAGKKRQTIRKVSKRVYRPGDKLGLFVNLHTPKAELLAITTVVDVIAIVASGRGVYLGGKRLDDSELAAFAVADGFANRAELVEFLDDAYDFSRVPFVGRVIRWDGLDDCDDDE